MSTFVLVHGGCHGAWCWYRLVPLLEAAGHRVITPDMPGHGIDRTPLKGLTQYDYADTVESVLRSLDEPAVLVGHSMGGMTVSLVAERCPELIDTLIYLAATVLSGGYSMMTDPAQAANTAALSMAMLPDVENDALIADPVATAPYFYSGCDPADIALAARLLSPEPLGAFATPIDVTDSRYGSVRRAGVVTLEDRMLPADMQRTMYAEDGITDIVTLPTGHSPFFAAPDSLAAALQRLAG